MGDALAAIFDGQPIFGAPPWLTTAPFAPTPLEVDAFLGLEPGTTVYASGPMFTVVSTLVGPTVAAVAAARATLQGFAGICSVFGRSNGLAFPGNYEYWRSCWFAAGELVFDTFPLAVVGSGVPGVAVPSSVVPGGLCALWLGGGPAIVPYGSQFTLSFRLVVRRVPRG
jgi:hypothetical protein